MGRLTLSADHWTTLTDAVSNGAVRRLHFNYADLRALKTDALLVAVAFRGLQSLVIRLSVVPSSLVTDALIHSSTLNGLLELSLLCNSSDPTPRFSEDALLNFYFTAGVAPAGQPPQIRLEGTGITESFVVKLFEVSSQQCVRDRYLHRSTRDWRPGGFNEPMRWNSYGPAQGSRGFLHPIRAVRT